jgi:hypothetical protein
MRGKHAKQVQGTASRQKYWHDAPCPALASSNHTSEDVPGGAASPVLSGVQVGDNPENTEILGLQPGGPRTSEHGGHGGLASSR